MIVRNRICNFKVKVIDPSKTETSFLLLISNLRKTSIFKTTLLGIARICLPELLRRIYRQLRNIRGTLADNH